jgi:hypothetical protein
MCGVSSDRLFFLVAVMPNIYRGMFTKVVLFDLAKLWWHLVRVSRRAGCGRTSARQTL